MTDDAMTRHELDPIARLRRQVERLERLAERIAIVETDYERAAREQAAELEAEERRRAFVVVHGGVTGDVFTGNDVARDGV